MSIYWHLLTCQLHAGVGISWCCCCCVAIVISDVLLTFCFHNFVSFLQFILQVTKFCTSKSSIAGYIYVTGFGKTDHIVTIDISRNTDLKHRSHHGSLVLDCSHARFAV